MRKKFSSIILVVLNGLVKKYFWYRKVCTYSSNESGLGKGYCVMAGPRPPEQAPPPPPRLPHPGPPEQQEAAGKAGCWLEAPG